MQRIKTKLYYLKLFVQGRRLNVGAIVTIVCAVVSLFYGSVNLPVPTIDPVGIAPATLDLLLGIFVLAVWAQVFSNDLTVIEHLSRRSWAFVDLVVALALFLPFLLLASLGDSTLLQTAAVLCAVYNAFAPTIGQNNAIAAIVLVLLFQAMLFGISESPAWHLATFVFREPTGLSLVFSITLFALSLAGIPRLKKLPL